MLVRLGYRVLEARNAAEAQRLYDEYAGAVDLLLAEFRMPRVNGQELARSLSQRDENMRVLYLADCDGPRAPRRSAWQKPLPLVARRFTIRMLADAVRAALDGPGQRLKFLTAGSPV